MELSLPLEHKGQSVVSLSRVMTTHKGEELVWDASKFIKTKVRHPGGFFGFHNQYFKTLTGEQHDALFAVYQELFTLYMHGGGDILRTRRIQDNVAELFKLLDWDRFHQWCCDKSVVTIPSDIPATFETTVQHGATRDKTYDMRQYRDLAILGLFLRFALPVVAVALAENDIRAGTSLKEQRTFRIFNKSVVQTLAPVDRMRVYIAAHTAKFVMPTSAIIEGMCSAELPAYLLARVLIRKVMLAEADDNVIKIAHRYIEQQQQAMQKGNGFGGEVRDKTNHSSRKTDEDNVSVAENYKVKQTISDGDLQTLVYYSQQLKEMAFKVDHSLDMNKLDICLRNLEQRPIVPSETYQKTLTQWVMASCMPARGIDSLNRSSLMRVMAVAQAVLWHWGFLDLALLMMTQRSNRPVSQFGPSNRTNLARKWHAEFAKRFPHYREPSSPSKDVRHQNVAYMAIEGPNSNNPNNPGLATMILQSEWIVRGPEELVQQIGDVTNGGYWYAPPDTLRDTLAELICYLYDLRYTQQEF